MYSFIEEYKKPLEEETFLSDYVNDFYQFGLNYYKDKLNRRTLYMYATNLEGFRKFIYFEYPDINNIRDICEDQLINYKLFCLKGLKNNKQTINSKLTALRYFFKYLTNKKAIDYNLSLNVDKFKIEDKLYPNIFTTRQIKILLANFLNKQYGIRDVLITELILTTGLEIEDILDIKMNDLLLSEEYINIAKESYPLSGEIIKHIKEYLNERIKIDAHDSVYLFLNRNGYHYSSRSYQLAFKNAITNTDIPVNYTPRYLKTTFLYNMAKIVDEEELQLITKQNSLKRYYKLLDNPLQNII